MVHESEYKLNQVPAREIVEQQIALLKEIGIGGIYSLGGISEPLYQIPVALNRIGVVQLGGLNPIAAASEAGIEIENVAESGFIDSSICIASGKYGLNAINSAFRPLTYLHFYFKYLV